MPSTRSEAPAVLTHSELVKIAERWLRREKKCGVVLTEFANAYPETPDALGWDRGGQSHMVECKVSVEDIKADARKVYRQNPANGIGRYKYLMIPAGLDGRGVQLPEGWGTLIVFQRGRVVPGVQPYDQHELMYRTRAELSKLISYVRRAQIRGFDGREFPGEIRVHVRRRRRRTRR